MSVKILKSILEQFLKPKTDAANVPSESDITAPNKNKPLYCFACKCEHPADQFYYSKGRPSWYCKKVTQDIIRNYQQGEKHKAWRKEHDRKKYARYVEKRKAEGTYKPQQPRLTKEQVRFIVSATTQTPKEIAAALNISLYRVYKVLRKHTKKTASERRLIKIKGLWHRSCRKCSITKPLADFPKSKSGLKGRYSVCKSCRYKK